MRRITVVRPSVTAGLALLVNGFLALSLLVLSFLVSSTALANATPSKMLPDSGGLVVPATTTEVRIERERLSFDLATVPNWALVNASYEMVNVSGHHVSLDLTFISRQGGKLAVSLDGVPLPVRETATDGLPREWIAPTQGIDPLTGEEYFVDEDMPSRVAARAWTFLLQLPAGATGRLDAQYQALPGYDRERHEYVVHHLAYVLGPARNWAGFGTLEVSVAVPSKYILASSPAMAKVADSDGIARYVATFQGIPSEILRVSTISSAVKDASGPGAALRASLPVALPVAAAALIGVLSCALCSRLKRPGLAGGAAGGAGLVFTPAVTWLLFAVVPTDPADASELAGNADYMAMALSAIAWTLFTLLLLPVLTGIAAGAYAGKASSRQAMRAIRDRNP